MLIDNIRKIFDDRNLFNRDKDTNEVDGLNGHIVVRKKASIEEKLKAINLCAVVGFESTALDLPIIKVIDEGEGLGKYDVLVDDFNFLNSIINLGKESSNYKEKSNNEDINYEGKDLPEISFRVKDLSEVTNKEYGLIIDTDNDFLGDKINSSIIIDENCSENEFIAACNIATTLGLNTLGCNLPIAFTSNNINDSNKISICIGDRFADPDKVNGNVKFVPTSNRLLICGKDEELIETSNYFCKNYENIIRANEVNLKDFKEDINEILKPQVNKNKVTIFEKEYNFDWEVDDVKSILNDKLLDVINEDDKVEIKILVSEEKEIRDDLKDHIKSLLRDKNIDLNKCSVLCSYKQALSWIIEELIPCIKETINLDDIGSIDIKFKPFLPEGKSKWDDEDGSIPNIDASRNDNPDKYFDLPIRLVQELFPVDDLIQEEIGLSRDNIEFKILEDGNSDYEFIVYNKSNEQILYDTFDIKYSERPYLDEFEGIGKVHPSTGLVEVKVNNKVVVSETVKTDVERIWDVYQSEILDECKNYILEESNNNPTKDKQPFFDVLKLDILTSEPDYKLNVRQDIISVLSSLHEDIYFAGLDFFKTLGLKMVNEALDEPGLILPIINKRNGQGTYMKATLEKSEDSNVEEFNLDLCINELSISSAGLESVYIDIDGEKSYLETIKSKINYIEEKLNLGNYSFSNLVLRFNDEEIYIKNNNKFVKEDKLIDIRDINIPQDRVIGYEEYIQIIDKLRYVKGINVWRASKSYQGREIYSIEILKEYKSSLISRTKLINNKPVFQINNRHHANEVSSTNSAFLLVEQLLLNKDYTKYLDKVNIVMIPFENVDGGYIHYELQKDNPEWQFHIARFNSVGKEFARDYFNEDSKYTESRALTKLWHKWLPDILVDNHGVPKHEWDQQFSGYTSPWFKGFWLPRALFYGYFWYLDDEKYPQNKILSEALQDVVSDYINNDEEVTKWNVDWQNRFEKYAHKWMPKLFPANYYKDLIYYWLPYKPSNDAWHVSHRYPWITALDWTTEVSDETAQGDYLDLCSRTHNISDIATIDMMYKAKFEKHEECLKKDNELVLKSVRVRPIQV